MDARSTSGLDRRPLLLDLGGGAGRWLGTRALAGYRVVRVDTPGGDPLRQEPASRAWTCAATAERLPLRDGVCAVVVVARALEHARDDLAALDEVARVLAPGGTLFLRTPRAGALAWLDPYNVYRYLSDATGRGPLPFESGELGWRRHYPTDEARALLEERGLRVVGVGGAGTGVSEAVVLGVLVVGRWLARSERVERFASRLVRPLVRREGNLPTGRWGYDVTIRAERPATAAAMVIAEGGTPVANAAA